MNEEVTVAMAAVGERKAVWRAVAMREKKEERAGEREREREREWRTGVVYGFFLIGFFGVFKGFRNLEDEIDGGDSI